MSAAKGEKDKRKRARWKLRETMAAALVETGRLLPGDDDCEVRSRRRVKIDAACDVVLRDWANAVLTSTAAGVLADPLRFEPRHGCSCATEASSSHPPKIGSLVKS